LQCVIKALQRQKIKSVAQLYGLRKITHTLQPSTKPFAMEAQLTDRLLNLSMKDEPEVTRNRAGECLFLCFVQSVNTQSATARNVEKNGTAILVQKPSQTLARAVGDRDKLDVSTTLGMRLLAADLAECMLDPATPHSQTAMLKRHILHRFRSSYIRQRDAEVLGDDVLPDNASDKDKFEAWCKLMRTSGTVQLLFRARGVSLHHCSASSNAGWGDTATVLVLSEALDIDVFLYLTPDPRVASNDLPNKFKPLLFRKSSHSNASPRKLMIRFHQGHFIYLTRFGEGSVRVGGTASQEHYLTGTHDVATGMCVPPHWIRLQRFP
jgi:hypothetical protein